MNTSDATARRAGGAISLACALDALAGEPPARIHPVALFGRLLAPIDREWRFPRAVGALASAVFPLGAASVAAGAVAAADRYSPLSGTLLAGGVLFATTSRRLLIDTARAVVADSERDLPRARRELRALAGRDSATLSAGQVRSAAVESASENLSDGLVAPLFAFALLAPYSLSAAAGACAWVKAVNTMDSMLGYRPVPTGWGPARLDDLVMWVPARLTAVSLAFAAGDPTALHKAAAWANEPSSPNAGWPMATLAAVLDVRLEKSGAYVLAPSVALPTVAEANTGITIVDRAALLATLLACSALALAPGRRDGQSPASSPIGRRHSPRADRHEPSRPMLPSLAGRFARVRRSFWRWLPWS